MKTIVIIARNKNWKEALVKGEYVQSTIDSSLDAVGFIHCSFPDQTIEIVNRRYANEEDLVLLLIDEQKVKSEVKYEGALSGRTGTFPHIYGPLNLDAVNSVISLKKNKEGKFIQPKEFLSN